MEKLFKDISLGGEFKISRKNEGHSKVYGEEAVMVYSKVSGTRAKCIKQTGYGNTRGVNGLYSFGPNSIIQTL